MRRTAWERASTVCVGLLVCSIAPIVLAGAPAISHLRYSADIGANIGAAQAFAERRDYVDDDLAGTRLRKQIAALPATANLRDFHLEANGDLLFALDIGTTLASLYFSPADVVRYNGSTFTREFDAAAAGVPAGVRCDGIARWGTTGKLLLSFDRTFTAAGTTIRPADVIVFSGGAFGRKLLDSLALNLPAGSNVDAIDTFRTRDYLLVSFDAGGSLGGVDFTSADLMQLHRIDHAWSRRYALATFADRWATANLDGVAALNVDTIFEDDLE